MTSRMAFINSVMGFGVIAIYLIFNKAPQKGVPYVLSEEYGDQSRPMQIQNVIPKVLLQDITLLLRWGRAPSCMKHILSKSRALWIMGMKYHSVFSMPPPNVPILLIDEPIPMKVGLIAKSNHVNIKVLVVNSVDDQEFCFVDKTQHPVAWVVVRFEFCMGRDANLQQQFFTVSSGLLPPVEQLV
ncbi:hypothetical protein TNCV_1360031 [Trichonephila clavipes]|nr:hypothetical protein TNCV_1360031 [Trichonephila clavipes]